MQLQIKDKVLRQIHWNQCNFFLTWFNAFIYLNGEEGEPLFTSENFLKLQSINGVANICFDHPVVTGMESLLFTLFQS